MAVMDKMMNIPITGSKMTPIFGTYFQFTISAWISLPGLQVGDC